MSLIFWRSVAPGCKSDWYLRHPLSCTSPAARCSLEELDDGILLARGRMGCARAICVDATSGTCAIDVLTSFVQLRVGTSLNLPNRFLTHSPLAVEQDKRISPIAHGGGVAMTMRQLETRGLDRPTCFDWWIESETACLPTALATVGEGVEPNIPSDAFHGRLITLIVSNTEALERLSATTPLFSVQHLFLHRCILASHNIFNAFPNLLSFAMDMTSRLSSPVDVDFLNQSGQLHYLQFKSCNLKFPSQSLECFHGLRVLILDACFGAWSWAWLGSVPRLESLHLDVENRDGGTAAGQLPQLPKLRRLATTGSHFQIMHASSQLPSLERVRLLQWSTASLSSASLGRFSTLLTDLIVSNNRSVTELDLTGCVSLIRLKVQHCMRIRLVNITGCSALTTLVCYACSALAAVEGVDTALSLTQLLYCRSPSLHHDFFKHAVSLQEVYMQECPDASICDFEQHPHKELFQLFLNDANIRSLTMPMCNNLTELRINSCEYLSSLRGLERLRSLTRLLITRCAALADIDVSGCPTLVTLELAVCRTLQCVHGLTNLGRLQTLRIVGCWKLSTINISGCKTLTSVELGGCTRFTAVIGTGGLLRLETLTVIGCHRTPVLLNVKGCAALRNVDTSGSSNALLFGWPRRTSSLIQAVRWLARLLWDTGARPHNAQFPIMGSTFSIVGWTVRAYKAHIIG